MNSSRRDLDSALDSLQGAAQKHKKDVVLAGEYIVPIVNRVRELLTVPHQRYNVRRAVVDRNILPELVAILDRDFGDEANARVYQAALDALDVITRHDQGEHVQAVADAGACPTLLSIVQLPNEDLFKRALKILVVIRDKMGAQDALPCEHTLRTLMKQAPWENVLCLDLMSSLLRVRTPSKFDAETCVHFLNFIIPRVKNYSLSRPHLRECARFLLQLHENNPNYLDGTVVDLLHSVQKRLDK